MLIEQSVERFDQQGHRLDTVSASVRGEAHQQVYVEVDQANDYGRDAYIDLTCEGVMTGQVIAVQVKGGESYRSGSGHFIPYSPADRALWVESSVPVLGIVHDPEDDSLYWVNLTEELGKTPADQSGRVGVDTPLTHETWPKFMSAAQSSSKRVGALLGLYSDDPSRQGAAVWDCLAVGPFDPRAFIMLRYSLKCLNRDVLPQAVFVLAHCIPFHPDIVWHELNLISGEVMAAVVRRLNWTADDAVMLMGIVDDENMFRRGTVGEHAYFLLAGSAWGPDVMDLLSEVLYRAVNNNDERLASKALAIMQYQVEDNAPNLLRAAFEEYPGLSKMRLPRELFDAVAAHGWIDIA